MRIQRSACDLPACEDLISLFDVDPRAVRNDIGPVFLCAAYTNFCLIVFSRFDGNDGTVCFADLRKSLWLSGFEQFFNSRKTLCDVAAGYAARMEGSHRQLRTWFTDGLCRCDTDCFTDVDFFTGRQIASVAFYADTGSGMAGHDRTDGNAFDAASFDAFCCRLEDLRILFDDHFAAGRIHDVVERDSADDPLLQRFDDFLAVCESSDFHALIRAAVEFSDDHVVGYVNQTSGQVTGVGCTQRGIGQAFSRTVGRNEVFQNGQALTEVGLDRDLYGLTGRVSHQTTHTADLFDLVLGTTGSGIRHDEQVVQRP